MGRAARPLLLAMFLMGCAPLPSELPTLSIDTSAPADFRCQAREFIVGSLVIDQASGISIRDDQGALTPMVWPPGYTSRWSSNPLSWGEAEVLDEGGSVMAVTGRSYRIGGVSDVRGFWACADVVIPQ
jgi:hypothetical protein